MACKTWSLLILLLKTLVLVNTDRVKPQGFPSNQCLCGIRRVSTSGHFQQGIRTLDLLQTPESGLASEDTVILVTDWGEPGRLLNVSLRHMNFTAVPVKDVKRPVAVDYDQEHDKLYWTDVFLKQIVRTDIKTKTDVVLVQLNKTATPDGIAVDAEEGILFYTDAGNNIISRVDIDSRKSQLIAGKDLQEPRAIVIHKEIRKLYWTDWGQRPRIETADYDGRGRKTLVSDRLAWPNGLALDKRNGRLFWCDAKRSVIETVQLDGSDRSVVLSEHTAHYFDIFYHQGMLYFTDWQRQKSLLHVPACGGRVGSLVSTSFNKLSGLHVVSLSNTGKDYILPECLAKCTNCRDQNSCDTVTGRCPGGCKDGRTGDYCANRPTSPATDRVTASSTVSTENPEITATGLDSTLRTNQQGVISNHAHTNQTVRYPSVGATVEETSALANLSFGMTVAVALGCFSAFLLIAIIALLVIHRIRRKREKGSFSNLTWASQQAFTNNTYTLMAGDTEDRSQVYLVPLDDPLKPDDESDHLYEDIDEVKKYNDI